MDKINRNAPCPCGSGRKYKKCCGAEQKPSPAARSQPGMRLKGGVKYDSEARGFVPIVHVWDNPYCHGEPREYQAREVFASEDEAMAHYKQHIRPRLKEWMAEMEKRSTDGTFISRELE